MVRRNDELETSNGELKRHIDSIAGQKQGLLQSRKSSKPKAKKSTPRSPQAANRILRSYNSINQVSLAVPFSKSTLNKTLNPRLAKKSLQQAGMNASMNDITNKSIANCMINNLYFIPKTLKT